MFEDFKPIHFAPAIMSQQIAMEPGDFERSFYYNLLLQPPLIILDTAFFTNIFLKDNLQARSYLGESWIETALKYKAIIPLFRNNAKNYTSAFSTLHKDQFSGMFEDSRSIAEVLDKSLNYYLNWPSSDKYNFGVNLAKTVSSIFLADSAPVAGDLPSSLLRLEIGKFWGNTEDWRNNWIKNSINLREKISGPGHGLRLSDLLNVAAKSLFKQDSIKVHSALELYELSKKILDDEKLFSLRVLLILLDNVWLQNFSRGIEIGYTVSRWHPITCFFDLNINSNVPEDEAERDYEFDYIDIIKLPSIDVLKRISGNTLSSIWKRGERYICSLHQWRAGPNKKNLEDLVTELGVYSRIILDETNAENYTDDFKIFGLSSWSLIPSLSSIAGTITSYATSNPLFTGAAVLLPVLSLTPVLKKFQKTKKTSKVYTGFKKGISLGDKARQYTYTF